MKILVSGSAGHYLYLLGLMRGLQIRDFDFSKVSEIHAYSSGCVVALMICLNIDINYAMKNLHNKILLRLNKSIFGAAFNFLNILREELLLFLNSIDDKIYKKANNRLFISISYLKNWKLSSEIISFYYSNSDLVDCCIASGFVPFYNKIPIFSYRGNYCIDSVINYEKPIDIQYNFRRDTIRDLDSIFGKYVFITCNYKKSQKIYELGMADSKLLRKFQC
jgi:hypothetical protein